MEFLKELNYTVSFRKDKKECFTLSNHKKIEI